MKKFFIFFSLAVFLALGIYSMVYMADLPRTYDGSRTKVADLIKNPSVYDYNDADGITNIIIKKNLYETHALNTVGSVTFDFRGYDTLGESFILLTAISGSLVILRNGVKKGENEDEQKHES